MQHAQPGGDGGHAEHGGHPFADRGVTKLPGTWTGRYLVLLDPRSGTRGLDALRSGAGIAPAQRVTGSESGGTAEALEEAGSVVFDGLGVAVVEAFPDQRDALLVTARESPAVLHVERERLLFASAVSPPPELTASADYLQGYRDGVAQLVDQALERPATAAGRDGDRAPGWSETSMTWGLQATGITECSATGRGVRVAVLDTGVALSHPDLAGRLGATLSFVAGESVEDGQGHGTHCVGTACGPAEPGEAPRYGVATEADIVVGKVLSDQGSGTDSQILAGINWAVEQGCRVISMSLGAPTRPGQPHSRVYEQVARRALHAGSILVAASGNESDRPGRVAPVGHPANCPSVLAVGAVDRDLGIAFFSSAGTTPDDGQVDIAAPGVDVLSSWPAPAHYERLMGTSMATPHVSGVLALLAEQEPEATAAELKTLLPSLAHRLPLPAADVGAGLVRAS
ncbi:S8 family serine peptidase [Streptomyces sp. ACA25]|uniref:S8 family serine peptidase n=1 Tax=Streptomyces sp. ACA25 TaxID=3022596 RepID=UPI002306F82C|nr:S8 family serine peptidase [Streptomyces sp. ACA25]MDB1088242.1 S8 family serine peptidase [Streptomyces sp. ACA25]